MNLNRSAVQPDQSEISRSLKELADLKFAIDESAIVVITDDKGVITYVNDTFCEISGYPREELIGKTHRIINSGLHPKTFWEEMWKTISSGQVWKGEIRNKNKMGGYYWVDTTIVPFIDEKTGEPYQYIAIRKDITYLKRIEDELRLLNEGLEERVRERTNELEAANKEIRETLERLQESERMRETFVSALTHDLRTPLVAEQRVLEIILGQAHSLPPKLQPLAERLLKNNRDLLDMVNKLLEVYQYEAGRVNLMLENVDLSDLVDTCFEKLAPLAESKKIQLKKITAASLPRIRGDEDQLHRLVMNLVGNAIQNIQEAGDITVSVHPENGVIEISVRDNGPGIAPEVLPHLFDRYFVLGQTRKKIGSGLGLSICKMIVRLHGGNIRVESELGVGTTFFVTLPLSQGELS